ncbi:MAG: hypothetical protein QNJ55_25760 [Xenococcus sp. MO_188.B8]|nr:hypothetical protein [Xenococcus sp. MO_188.B8]
MFVGSGSSAASVPAPAPSCPLPWWFGASCSLAVRAAVVPPSCCLLRSRSGRPLFGAARSSRVGRLRRAGVLV